MPSLNPNPIPHNGSAPNAGFWIKLPPGQTGQTYPLTLLYDAPAAKRPVFSGAREVEFCTQTFDNSKAFIIVWSGQTEPTTYPESMTPIPYEFIPVLMSGTNAVRTTVSTQGAFPGHYEKFQWSETLNPNSVRLWGIYDMDIFDSLVDGLAVAPNALVSGANQPIGGRIVIRQYSGAFGFIVKDNAFRWTGTGWVFDQTLSSWNGTGDPSGPPPPITGVEYQVAFTRTITYNDPITGPTVSDEQFQAYNPIIGTLVPNIIRDFFAEGYVLIFGPSIDTGPTLSVMIETLDDDFTKVDLVALTDLTYGIGQMGDVCPIGGVSHALYAVMAADGVTLHYGLLGPPTPSIVARPGPKRVSYA